MSQKSPEELINNPGESAENHKRGADVSASSFPCSTEYRQLICADTLGESPLECTRAYLGNVDVIFLQCEYK
jgi:hypothetical protein